MLPQNSKNMNEFIYGADQTPASADICKITAVSTDAEIARAALDGHTIVLCRRGELTISDKRGISPMMDWIAEGRDMRGSAAADIIVGKAAAMLFVLSGIAAVHARTLSRAGLYTLRRYGIEPTYETLTDNIKNRAGTDICPMERGVLDIDDPALAYDALLATLKSLRQGSQAAPGV